MHPSIHHVWPAASETFSRGYNFDEPDVIQAHALVWHTLFLSRTYHGNPSQLMRSILAQTHTQARQLFGTLTQLLYGTSSQPSMPSKYSKVSQRRQTSFQLTPFILAQAPRPKHTKETSLFCMSLQYLIYCVFAGGILLTQHQPIMNAGQLIVQEITC